MVVFMKDNGILILSMEKDMKNLQTNLPMMECILMVNQKELVHIFGQMESFIKENGLMD